MGDHIFSNEHDLFLKFLIQLRSNTSGTWTKKRMPPIYRNQVRILLVDITCYFYPVERIKTMQHSFIRERQLFVVTGIVLCFARKQESRIKKSKVDQLNVELLRQFIT